MMGTGAGSSAQIRAEMAAVFLMSPFYSDNFTPEEAVLKPEK